MVDREAEDLERFVRERLSKAAGQSTDGAQMVSMLREWFQQQQKNEAVTNEDIAQKTNQLLGRFVVQLYENADRSTMYKLVPEVQSVSMRTISHDSRQVLQLIQAEGMQGIGKNSIGRKLSGIRSEKVDVILKELIEKHLVHIVKSPRHRQKMFLAFGVAAGPELVGNVFYVEGGSVYDKELVESLSKTVLLFLSKNSLSSLQQILDFVSTPDVFSVKFSPEDLLRLIRTLVYDGKVEETLMPNGDTHYHSVHGDLPVPGFYYTPCYNCPLLSVCDVSGAVSPLSCPYMKNWIQW